MSLKCGLIHTYIGDGKGKSTCSIGLAIRALGSGLKVCIIQFFKEGLPNEIKILNKLDNIDVFEFESDEGSIWSLNSSEKELLKDKVSMELKIIDDILHSGEYDLVILDEVLTIFEDNLAEFEKFKKMLTTRVPYVEVVLTGRSAPPGLLEVSDYVSDVVSVKHPFDRGVFSREGIEY